MPNPRYVQSIPEILRKGLNSKKEKQIACAILPYKNIKHVVNRYKKGVPFLISNIKRSIKKIGTYSEKLPCDRTLRFNFFSLISSSILRISLITGLPLKYPTLNERKRYINVNSEAKIVVKYKSFIILILFNFLMLILINISPSRIFFFNNKV
jgi:hypothetical protein